MEEKEEAFMRRLDAAALAEQTRLDKKREEQECQLPLVGTYPDVPVRPILYVLWNEASPRYHCSTTCPPAKLDTR